MGKGRSTLTTNENKSFTHIESSQIIEMSHCFEKESENSVAFYFTMILEFLSFYFFFKHLCIVIGYSHHPFCAQQSFLSFLCVYEYICVCVCVEHIICRHPIGFLGSDIDWAVTH